MDFRASSEPVTTLTSGTALDVSQVRLVLELALLGQCRRLMTTALWSESSTKSLKGANARRRQWEFSFLWLANQFKGVLLNVLNVLEFTNQSYERTSFKSK